MPVLYRLQLLQAAPGRLLDRIDVVKKHAAVAASGGEAAPVIMRHSQGDHWDLEAEGQGAIDRLAGEHMDSRQVASRQVTSYSPTGYSPTARYV